MLGAVRQPQLRRSHPSRLPHELPRVAAARRRVRARRARWTSTSRTTRSATGADGDAGVPARHLADVARRSPTVVGVGARDRACSRSGTRTMLDGDERWRALPAPTGERYAWDRRVHVHPQAAVPRRHRRRARAADRHRRRARARAARRQRHDRPHLAGGRHPPRRPGGASGCSSTASPVARLQLLRRAPRQPRGDGARHVRERAAAQPARARAPRAASRCTFPTASR